MENRIRISHAVFTKFVCLTGNGSVSRDEWSKSFQLYFGGTEEEADKIFTRLDKDKNGEVSLEAMNLMFLEMDADGKFSMSDYISSHKVS